MALPLALGALGRAAVSHLPNAANSPAAKKAGGEVLDQVSNFFKNGKNEADLLGKNGKPGLVDGFKNLFKGMPDKMKDDIVDAMKDQMKSAFGMDDKAYSAFSSMLKGDKISQIPLDQLLSAGRFVFDMASQL